jgi:hypothetical protein
MHFTTPPQRPFSTPSPARPRTLSPFRSPVALPSYHPNPTHESNAPGCVSSHRCRSGSSELVPTARSQRSRPDRTLLKTVTPERGYTTTASDLLANRWQLAILLPPGMRQAGCWTRPRLLVWGGAPRRNRTGDPILTMEPPGTAVRTAVPPGHARPSGPKLSVLLRRRYALTSAMCWSSGRRRSGAGGSAGPLPAGCGRRASWNTAATAGVALATTWLNSWPRSWPGRRTTRP